MPPRRAFVFITNIPDYLLEPLVVAENTRRNRLRASRDPRYERLRLLLSTHTSGIMHVMHLETRGYALALYASEEEALSACKTSIIPKQRQREYPPLVLRVLERPRPAPLQSVYTPTLTIEGETVLKEELASTRGLELVYRGRAVARWCPSTTAQQDCPFGASCNWVHKCAYQQTVWKRRRADSALQQQQERLMSPQELARMGYITRNAKVAEELLVPPDMKCDFSVYVPVSREEALSLVDPEGTQDNNRLLDTVVRRVEAACTEHRGPYFAKFAFPGGAPWDWSLHCATVGVPALRGRSPFPANGAPTPLERDIFIQQLLYHMNQLNRFNTIASAMHAFRASPKVRKALLHELQHEHSVSTTEDVDKDAVVPLYICVRPWLFLPTASVEATLFLEDGGGVVRGITQRRGALRLMISHALLYRQQKRQQTLDFSRFAVLGNGQDTEAESCLEAEIGAVTLLLKRVTQKLQHHIRQQREHLPARAVWCVQVAISPPPSVSVESHFCEDAVVEQSEQQGQENGEKEMTSKCFILSLHEYRPRLEEQLAFHGELRGGEVAWSTKRHGYVSLIPRELLERLHQEAPMGGKQ